MERVKLRLYGCRRHLNSTTIHTVLEVLHLAALLLHMLLLLQLLLALPLLDLRQMH